MRVRARVRVRAKARVRDFVQMPVNQERGHEKAAETEEEAVHDLLISVVAQLGKDFVTASSRLLALPPPPTTTTLGFVSVRP